MWQDHPAAPDRWLRDTVQRQRASAESAPSPERGAGFPPSAGVWAWSFRTTPSSPISPPGRTPVSVFAPVRTTAGPGWLLDLLGLEGLQQRYPHQLSGGQRQRLALARALAPAPQVVLLDEPFSNLDVEVRLRLRSELSTVLRLCGASGLLVTHDPGEALAICDRVAVMRDGVLHQCASPRSLVQDPATPFVGRFVLQGNLLPVDQETDGRLRCDLGLLEPVNDMPIDPLPDRSTVLVDPCAIALEVDPEAEPCVMGREFLGQAWQYRIQAGDLHLRLSVPLDQDVPRGTRCRLTFRPEATAILFPHRIRVRASDPCDDATQRAVPRTRPAEKG